MARMVFWLTLAAATAWLLWYMVKVPGVSYSGALAPLGDGEKVIAGNLRRHVAAIASRDPWLGGAIMFSMAVGMG